MSALRLSGLVGTVDLTVARGEQTLEASRDAGAVIPHPPAPSAYLRRNGAQWGGVSATVVQQSLNSRFGSGYYVPQNADRFLAGASTSGNTIHWQTSDSTFTAARWIGGTAEVWRVVNGEIVTIRDSAIVAGNFATWHRLLPAGTVVNSPSWQHRFADFNAVGQAYWFGLAARDAGGAIGAIGYHGHVPPSFPQSIPAASNGPTTDLGVDYTTGGALPAPANIAITADPPGNGLVTVAGDLVSGAVGYVPFLAYADPAGHPAFPFLTLADDGPPVLPGDHIIVRKLQREPRRVMASKRVWGAFNELVKIEHGALAATFDEIQGIRYTYKDFTAQDPAPEPGLDAYVSCPLFPTIPFTDFHDAVFHSHSGQSFYEVLVPGRTYRFRVMVRTQGPVGIRLVLFPANTPSPAAVTVNSATWTEVSFDFTLTSPLPVPSAVGSWRLQLENANEEEVAIDLCALEVSDTTLPTWGAVKPVIAAAVTPGMWLRDHWQIKNKNRPHTLRQTLSRAGQAPATATLHMFLEHCRDLGCLPWMQIEWYFRQSEWSDIMAYLGAPVSSGHWAAQRRADMGQVAPWTEVFPALRLEFGNEAWNSLAEFWQVWGFNGLGGGATYGLIARRAALTMMASPYWSDKITWVLGGWSRQSFGADAARTFRLPCEVGIANYNGGWDEGTALVQENAGAYASLVSAVPITLGDAIEDNVTRLQALAAEPGSGYIYGQTLKPTCYEAGPGYQLNGLNGASVTPPQVVQQEVVMKSKAAATATLETFCKQAAEGYALNNFFILNDQGDYWQSHSAASQGGAPFPAWQMVRALQAEVGGGAAVASHIELEDVTNTVANQQGGNVEVRTTWAYAITRGSRMAIVVGNRDLGAARKPTLMTAIRSATGARAYYLGGSFMEHNRYAVGTRPATPILVAGAGQTGGTLRGDGFSFVPAVGQTFTIDGDAQSYEVTGVTENSSTDYTLAITPNLAATPADNAAVAWSTVTAGQHADTKCVSINVQPQTLSVPADLSEIVIDDALGATANGIEPGCCIIVVLDGVVMRGPNDLRDGSLEAIGVAKISV